MRQLRLSPIPLTTDPRRRILLFISDLHLQQSRPDITEALVWFLREIAPEKTRKLYILGDLFEIWIGDDASDSLGDLVAGELKKLADRGIDITLLHGNRDFLLGDSFASRCGARLAPEPLVFNYAGKNFALLHGDVLCTRDIDYLKFRDMVRDSQWQSAFLAQSLEQRQEFARQARSQSQAATAAAQTEIMDVTESAVVDLLKELQVDTIIHGHTHRPAIHDMEIDDPACRRQRVVLGDWDSHGWYGQIDKQGEVSLHRFDLPVSR